jgi:class 3 adenylate cyclase
MSAIALEYGATIDKFIGDAIMLFFGDPETRGAREDAIACVKMAVAMQKRMRDLQAEWRERGAGARVPASHRHQHWILHGGELRQR